MSCLPDLPPFPLAGPQSKRSLDDLTSGPLKTAKKAFFAVSLLGPSWLHCSPFIHYWLASATLPAMILNTLLPHNPSLKFFLHTVNLISDTISWIFYFLLYELSLISHLLLSLSVSQKGSYSLLDFILSFQCLIPFFCCFY